VKKAQVLLYKFVAGFALFVITFWGCKEDLNKVGYDLLLPGDLISARKDSVDKSTVKSYTVMDELLRTNKPKNILLGTFNDPIFGKTTTDFACQFRVDTLKDLTGAIIDSLVLGVFYKEIYGDRVTPQNLKVYELNSALNGNDTITYYQDINLKGMANNEVLAEINYVPKFDTIIKKAIVDTVEQEILFKLNLSWAQKFKTINDSLRKVHAPTNVNDVFINLFKGLYIEAGDLNEGGSVMKALGSVMKLYYHNAKDTLVAKYKINSNSARTSRFVHDYSTASFKPYSASFNPNPDSNLDQQDSLIYLQTTGGLNNKIYLPTLSNWKDSTGCAINKAELIFQVEKSAIDTSLYPVPRKIILSLINDSLGNVYSDAAKQKLIFPSDLDLGEAYYGGYYNKADGTYRFNLANHLQDIIKGKKRNFGFYLTTDNKNAIFRRLVLKGATSKTGIRFNITYTKIKK